jgi:hypothetical protein
MDFGVSANPVWTPTYFSTNHNANNPRGPCYGMDVSSHIMQLGHYVMSSIRLHHICDVYVNHANYKEFASKSSMCIYVN